MITCSAKQFENEAVHSRSIVRILRNQGLHGRFSASNAEREQPGDPIQCCLLFSAHSWALIEFAVAGMAPLNLKCLAPVSGCSPRSSLRLLNAHIVYRARLGHTLQQSLIQRHYPGAHQLLYLRQIYRNVLLYGAAFAEHAG